MKVLGEIRLPHVNETSSISETDSQNDHHNNQNNNNKTSDNTIQIDQFFYMNDL